jgi:hypothetical protein
MCELTDAAVSIDDISGRLFRELRELEEPRSPLKRFAALDCIVLALGKRAGGNDGLLGSGAATRGSGRTHQGRSGGRSCRLERAPIREALPERGPYLAEAL